MVRLATTNDMYRIVQIVNAEVRNTDNQLVCDIGKTYTFKEITSYVFPSYCQIYVKEVGGTVVGFIKGRLDPTDNIGMIDFLIVESGNVDSAKWALELIRALAIDFSGSTIPCSTIQGQFSAPELYNLLKQFNVDIRTVPDTNEYYFTVTCADAISGSTDWLAQH